MRPCTLNFEPDRHHSIRGWKLFLPPADFFQEMGDVFTIDDFTAEILILLYENKAPFREAKFYLSFSVLYRTLKTIWFWKRFLMELSNVRFNWGKCLSSKSFLYNAVLPVLAEANGLYFFIQWKSSSNFNDCSLWYRFLVIRFWSWTWLSSSVSMSSSDDRSITISRLDSIF